MSSIIQFKEKNTREIKLMSRKNGKEAKRVGEVKNFEGGEKADNDSKSGTGTRLFLMGVLKKYGTEITLLAGLVSLVISFNNKTNEWTENFTKLTCQVNKLDESIKEMNSEIEEMDDKISNDHAMLLTLYAVSDKLQPQIVFLSANYNIREEVVKEEERLAEPPWKMQDLIGKSNKSDKNFKAEELTNTPAVFVCEEGEKETFFYGQYNDRNQWNGKCILNVYTNNKLETVFEGVYDNGTLVSYKRAASDNGKWIVTDRDHYAQYNDGETWYYTKTSDYEKEYTINEFSDKQILTVEGLLGSKEETILSYYKGKTSNGLYNDDSGNAFLITYFEQGAIKTGEDDRAIKTIYQGGFVDGKYDDDSYDAWYITRDKKTTYMYYKGGFSKGNVNHRDKSKEVFHNYLTHEEIDEYLKVSGFTDYSSQFVTDYDN